MKFEIGQRVKLIEEQALEDMCPVKTGEEGRIIDIELSIGSFDSDMLFVLWDNHPEQDYAVWDWEVKLVEQENAMNFKTGMRIWAVVLVLLMALMAVIPNIAIIALLVWFLLGFVFSIFALTE